MRRTGAALLALCCLAALVACAPEPSESPSESLKSPPTSDEVAHASEVAPDDAEDPAYERVATGTLVPVDGKTTGAVTVTLEETDIGIRSGGEDIIPSDHVEPQSLPFTGEGWEMTDVVLYTQDTESGDGCINTVVARAALHWTE